MEHKILFTGAAGAGKTTAIGAVSEISPLTTDVANNDVNLGKLTTTVGLDYGELSLDGGDKLRLYGTPGQSRFDFMWKILSRGALGLVILIDNRSANPLQDLNVYLQGFAQLIADTACVVAVGRMETHAHPDLDVYASHLEKQGIICPVVSIDVRQTAEVVELLELLLLQLESKKEF